MRSLLFAPGDDGRKLEKAAASGADVILIDLEDAVALPRKGEARKLAADFIRARHGMGGPALYVRVNALESGLIEDDLDAVMAAGPAGIMLPKAEAGRDVAHLGAKLAVREAENALADGSTRILAIAPETCGAVFHLASFAGASRRLAGIAWGAEDLAADVGARANREDGGGFTEPFRLVRNLTLFGARAAGAAAIDTVFPNFKDIEGLSREAHAAARDGFSAKLAIHPAQIGPINAAFTPAAADIDHARAVLAAFAAAPEAGVLNVGGRMVDRPHIVKAEQVLARAAAAGVA